MTHGQKAIELIMQFEGLRLKPYLCKAGVTTIGYGSTRYPNGVRVTLKDPAITPDKALQMLMFDVAVFSKDVDMLTKAVKLNQNRFDALVSFAYNVGSDIDIDSTPEGLGDSTLLKKVLKNPDDLTIRTEFMKWINANGKPLQGLINRRKAEADLYFQK